MTLNLRTVTSLAAFALAAVTPLLFATPSQAADAAVKTKPGTATHKVRGGGTNNPSGPKITPPADKGGPKTRGGSARLHFDNHTDWYVKVYVDDVYQGTVAPWGDLYYSCHRGTYTLYGQADFDDGSTKTWGPTDEWDGGNFSWELDE